MQPNYILQILRKIVFALSVLLVVVINCLIVSGVRFSDFSPFVLVVMVHYNNLILLKTLSQKIGIIINWIERHQQL